MHKSATATALEPLAIQIPEACKMLGCGRSKLYELIQQRELKIVKIGMRTTITVESIRSYHARLLAQQSQAA